MGAVVVIQSSGIAAGGGDVTPGAVNWDNIANVGELRRGVGYNAAVTFSAITSPIQLKATWTSTSPNQALGVFIKNGTGMTSESSSPVYVNVSNGDMVYFWMTSLITPGVGNYDTGTVTVTNESDGGATLDTFTFAIQYVPSSQPGDDGDDPPG